MEGNSGGGAATGGGGGGSDVELVSKTLQVEHKLFYFDLKENPRGRYLKISEKTSATRSTIIVPSSGIPWFLDLFNYYVNSEEHELFSKELQLDSKVSLTLHLFFFSTNGRWLFWVLCGFRCFTLTSVITGGGGSWRYRFVFFSDRSLSSCFSDWIVVWIWSLGMFFLIVWDLW